MRRVRAEAARKVKGLDFRAAEAALGHRDSFYSGSRYDGPAALSAERFGQRLREGRRTGMADRNRAASVEDLGAGPARRSKGDRGNRLAHPAEMRPNGIGDTGHGALRLRPREPQGNRKMMKLARFVPIARGREPAKVYVLSHKLGSQRGESLFRGGLARVFPRSSRNSAPKERLRGAFAEVPLRTRCSFHTCSP
jgi:hypothetical protein